MPRHDWNTPSAHTQKPRHGQMHSGAHGQGHSKKRRAAKRASTAPRYGRDRKPDAPMQKVVRHE